MVSMNTDAAEKAQTKIQSEMAQQDVKDNVSSLKKDVADLASSVRNLADAELGNVATSAQDAAQRGLGEVESRIRKNPTQAALVAAGVGFVVGLILAR
jgi:ElaB/YqjD/DUF883 family membrane-anchored ribosome-binding protein